ncbi:MAG: DMT family transporter [Bacteroidales bacterium]|nr:DMT family transporter [Bacteroidales bacterium]MBN2820313.1 DMT family transporter [Bacteroidales bacterium]
MKETNNGLGLTYFFLVLAMICWGLSFVWYKLALVHFRPISLVLARLIFSFPLLMLSALLMKRLNKINRKDIPNFMLLALFEPFLYFMGESFGMQYVSSTVASILIATIPIFTSVLAYFIYKEKLTANNYFGVMLSFAGVLIVIFADSRGFSASWLGILLMLVAVFSGMWYGFSIKRIGGKYNSLTIVSVQNLIGTIYFLPFFFIFDFNEVISKKWTFEMLLPMLYLSLFASTIAYIGFIQGLRKLGVSKATVFANFIPVFTAVFAFFILGEPITFFKIAGIILVIAGLIMAQASNRRRLKKPEEIILDERY